MAAKTKPEPKTRAREIAGIALLGFSIFSFLSLLSMHVGATKMMGPGGAAAASGLYSLAGWAAYLLVAALFVTSLRCFRGQSIHGGVLELLAMTGGFAALTVLLHLPFAHSKVAFRGPGGLLGQWAGEILASFIGTIGAALAALTLMAVCLVLVTSIRLAGIATGLGWVGQQLAAAGVALGRGIGRVVMAMFPEKDDADIGSEAEDDQDPDAMAFTDESETKAMSLDETMVAPRTLVGVAPSPDAPRPSAALAATTPQSAAFIEYDAGPLVQSSQGVDESMDSVPVRSRWDEDREAVAALVAEVAAADCPNPLPTAELVVAAAPMGSAARPQVYGPVTEPDPAAAVLDDASAGAVTGACARSDAPIIVEPLRPAADPAHMNDGPGFIKYSDADFQTPGTDLLEYKPSEGAVMDRQSLYDMAERLEQAMANYGVKGKVREIHMGPVVTMYEFAPAPGTRVGKLMGLEADLALSLEAQAVRVTSIPGKSVVGVEVPNKKREMVYIKEILEDDCFTKAGSHLQVCLGKDIKGAPVSVNLAKMPHLLVAGTTGSGKSVAVNGMITSILYNATPEDVRFIMVDPKMLELSIYEGIPHLLLPVVTDPNKANLALRWAVEEMERRYELLSKAGVRDIAGYNARLDALSKGEKTGERSSGPARRMKVTVAEVDGSLHEVEVDADSQAAALAAELPGPVPIGELNETVSAEAAAFQAAEDKKAALEPARKLPYIVIVIDEFADLMMVAPKDVETSVARIAQKARAAGLHLVLATQRPSVDVITGLIKANFPSRIALQVASKIDSRTILDQPGAETLLGNGDMLFSDRGTKLRRIHGAFLSDDEVHRVVDFLKKQAKPVYDMDILKPRDEEGDSDNAPVENFSDALYDQAVAIVCDTRQASVSFIQRRLQIGYNRAARMVEQMEREGIVGPANGMKPREIIAPTGSYLQAP